MVRYRILQAKTTEPAIGQVQMHFLAQAAFRTDAVAVADDQHPDHQFRIDRGPTRVAVILGQVLTQLAQIEALVDAAKQVILWNVIFEIEGVEQSILAIGLKPHHIKVLHSFDMRNINIRNIET